MTEHLTMSEMRAVLRHRIDQAGGIRQWCIHHDIPSHSSVSQMLSGKRDVSEIVANCCGFIAETTFRKLSKETANG